MADTSSAAALKRVNVGGYANFYTGTKKALIGEPHPRDRLYIYGEDIVDIANAEDNSQYQGIRMYATTADTGSTGTAESTQAQNTVDMGHGIGIVLCSYILGYAMNWEFFRGLKRVIKTNKNLDGQEYVSEVERFEQVKSAMRVQLQFMDGVEINAPNVSQQQRKKGTKPEIGKAKVAQLSIGVPSALIDKDGKHIRLSLKKKKKKKADDPDEYVGLGISESYFDEFLSKSEALRNVVASYNIAEETMKNMLRPKIDFSKSSGVLTTSSLRQMPEREVVDAEVVDTQFVDAQLILPPAKTMWLAPNSVGAIVGVKDNVIPIRVPAYEINQLFEDML